MLKQLLKDHNFLDNSPIFIIESSTFNTFAFQKSTAYNTFQFEKLFWIWGKVLDTIILWQDVGPCCEQTHAAFEVVLSLDQGQGVYSGWSVIVVSSIVPAGTAQTASPFSISHLTSIDYVKATAWQDEKHLGFGI